MTDMPGKKAAWILANGSLRNLRSRLSDQAPCHPSRLKKKYDEKSSCDSVAARRLIMGDQLSRLHHKVPGLLSLVAKLHSTQRFRLSQRSCGERIGHSVVTSLSRKMRDAFFCNVRDPANLRLPNSFVTHS